MTPEEILARSHERVRQCGFTIAGVEPDLDHPPWLYTVGLVEHDHPELAVLGLPLEVGHQLLFDLGHRVVDGREAFLPPDELVVGELTFHVTDVDDRLWDSDLFNQWKEYYAWRGELDVEAWAVELVVCGLSLLRGPAGRPNRAARRAAARRKRSP